MKDIFVKKRIQKDPTVVVVDEEPDDVTDEIIKSLNELKEVFDLPTEEVERAIDSRRLSKQPHRRD